MRQDDVVGAQCVLVVDDDERVRTVVRWQLEADGFGVVEASDGARALVEITERKPDLVVLDLTLPAVPGLDVLSRVRRTSRVPVILLTGRGGESERVVGLDLGADDYMVKPFSPAELAARVRSVLRRVPPGSSPAPAGTPGQPSQRSEFDGLVIDAGVREVTVRGAAVELTAKEFDLLLFLSRAPRQVFSRSQLLESVWSSSTDWQDEATVTQHIHRLRHKIERDAAHPRWLSTVRGAGYRFEP